EHLARVLPPDDGVRDGAAFHRHADQVLLGVLRALGDGVGDFIGLAEPGTDRAVAIPDHDDGVEREAPAALHDLCHARYRYETLTPLLRFGRFPSPTVLLYLVCHVPA